MIAELRSHAVYARAEEDRLRREFGRYSPIIELEITPDGLHVKGGAWVGDDKCVSVSMLEPYPLSDIRGTIRNVADSLYDAMKRA